MHHRVNHPSVISESLDGEVVIIALGTGTYYSLRGPAARAWDDLAAGCSVADTAVDLAESYATAGIDVPVELQAFIATLLAHDLLQPLPEPPAAVEPPPPVREERPWEPLVVETFTDMQDLILLDPVHEVEPGQGWPTAIAPTDT